MIYFAAFLLIGLTVVGLLYPALRQTSGLLAREDSVLSMLHDQLGELDRDVARGIISDAEARAARVEIQRRIIAVDHDDTQKLTQTSGDFRVMAVISVMVPVAAVALYFQLGNLNTPSMPFADRGAEQASAQEIGTLTQQLQNRLLADETGGPTDGWILLGETYMRVQDFANAANAFGQLIDRPDATSGIFTRYAEALVMDEGGIVTPRADRAIDRGLALEPSNPAASYYKALFLEQNGAPDRAHALLLTRLDAADGFYPWMASYVDLANFIAADIDAALIDLTDYAPALRGPTSDDIANAADLSTEDRSDFIASMVDRLATRLADEPDDLDGWLQLARAYTVLGQVENARAAYESASKLVADLPEADVRRQQVIQGLAAVE